MSYVILLAAAIACWLFWRTRRKHAVMEEASQMAVYEADYRQAMGIKRRAMEFYSRNLTLLPPERASQEDMEATIYFAAAAIDRMNALDGEAHGRTCRTALRMQLLQDLHAEAHERT